MPKYNVRLVKTETTKHEAWVEVEADDEDQAGDAAIAKANDPHGGVEWEDETLSMASDLLMPDPEVEDVEELDENGVPV